MSSRSVSKPTADRLRAWRAFLTAHQRIVGGIERDLAAAGKVPLAWYDVLLALIEAPTGRLRMRELAEAVVLSRSGLTRLVDRVEAAGLVRREACPDDRRGQHAVVTPAGRAALRAAWPVYAGAIESRFARHLGAAEARRLAALLERVIGETGASGPT